MTVRSDRPQGLGRGLAALIPQRSATSTGSIEIPLARIRENPRQPRLRMDDEALAALAESIRQHGVIQPILVTETIDGYQLVAGERRVRAARLAGLERVPAIVRQLADRAAARARARREPPARGPRPDRSRARIPAAGRRVRVQPGGPRDPRGAARGRPSPTPCACSSSTRASRTPSPTAGSPRATPGRSVACRTRRRRGRSTSVVARRPVRPPDRGARPTRPRAARPSRRTAQRQHRRPRDRACRGGPPTRAGDQGSTRPDAARRQDRDRVLRRRRARPDLPAARGRGDVTESRAKVTAAAAEAAVAHGDRQQRRQWRRPEAGQGGLRLHRGEHPGPRGPRGRPQAAGHVHRLDRRARPPPPRLGGRRQLDRRGDGRPRHRTSASRSSADGIVEVIDDGRGIPVGKHSRPARTPSRSCTPSSTPAASSAAAATRCPAACTASASAWSTRSPSGCASSRARRQHLRPGIRARASRRAP